MIEFTDLNSITRPVSDDVIQKLKLSRQAAQNIKTRDVPCPICHFKAATISVAQTDIFYIKCQKCKFAGPLSPAYFRRQKKIF